MSPETQSPTAEQDVTASHTAGLNTAGMKWGEIAAALVTLAIVVWFYFFVDRFGKDYHRVPALQWLYSAWNPTTDYEHGKLVPLVMVGLIAYQFKEIRRVVSSGSWWGLLFVVLGSLCFVAACRTIQPRIAIGGLPLILWGTALYLWGWQVGKLLAFPLFLLWLAIPLPTFQQATTHLQLIATQLAHHGSGLFGVETYTQGTLVLPKEGDWKPLSIAHGCSGIRSLMALIMISAVWAYVANMSFWKRFLLFASALPIAILGNALRVVSIFVIAEYGNAEWAASTWHDWSGLLLFYPISLFLLLLLHSTLEGRAPWRLKRKVTRRVQTPQSVTDEPSTES